LTRKQKQRRTFLKEIWNWKSVWTKKDVHTQQKDASKDAPLEARRVPPPPNASIDLAGTKNANATKDDMRAHILLEKKECKKNGLKEIWNLKISIWSESNVHTQQKALSTEKVSWSKVCPPTKTELIWQTLPNSTCHETRTVPKSSLRQVEDEKMEQRGNVQVFL
jgi:hypothetical protein